jgi:hypothetical protein
MRDIDSALTAFLLAQPGLTAVAGQRIHASLYLPKGYKPDDGPAMIFNPRGGGQDYSSLVLSPSYQFRSFGLTQAEARRLDLALYDALNDAQCFPIKMARMESIGQLFQEPDTGWPFVLTFYRIDFSN